MQPIIPINFLVSVWENIPLLCGHKQNDAHEFFLELVSALHIEQLQLNPKPPKRRRTSKQELVDGTIDDVFLGRLQSEVICTVCR